MDRVSPEIRSRIMAQVKGKNTRPEKYVRSVLHSAGFRFRLHLKDLEGKPDIYLPRYRVAVFVHGCFWHGHQCRKGRLPTTNHDFWRNKILTNQRRDDQQQNTLIKAKIKVFVVWECSMDTGITKVLEYLHSQRVSLN